jgi:hypothetical protein
MFPHAAVYVSSYYCKYGAAAARGVGGEQRGSEGEGWGEEEQKGGGRRGAKVEAQAAAAGAADGMRVDEEDDQQRRRRRRETTAVCQNSIMALLGSIEAL